MTRVGAVRYTREALERLLDIPRDCVIDVACTQVYLSGAEPQLEIRIRGDSLPETLEGAEVELGSIHEGKWEPCRKDC